MDKKTAVIFASRPVTAGMRQYVTPGAFVVGADAGWKNAQSLGLEIDLALGDFDSSEPPACAREVIYLPAEKDDTDTHFAAKELLFRGYSRFVLLGIFGGRLDHEMANYHTLLYLARQGAQVLAPAEGFELRCMAPGVLHLSRGNWRWLSVFAAGGPAANVTLEGVKYPLTNAVLAPDMPIGVSNEFAAGEALIRCGEGYLYVMVSE